MGHRKPWLLLLDKVRVIEAAHAAGSSDRLGAALESALSAIKSLYSTPFAFTLHSIVDMFWERLPHLRNAERMLRDGVDRFQNRIEHLRHAEEAPYPATVGQAPVSDLAPERA